MNKDDAYDIVFHSIDIYQFVDAFCLGQTDNNNNKKKEDLFFFTPKSTERMSERAIPVPSGLFLVMVYVCHAHLHRNNVLCLIVYEYKQMLI